MDNSKQIEFITYEDFRTYCEDHENESYCTEMLIRCERDRGKRWRAIVTKTLEIVNRISKKRRNKK
nr:MAG: hypothetical protein [Lokiarchaeota virus Ratatoskr Meg22_1012]